MPGVPRAWCEGVALLAALPAPDTITPARWAVLAATSVRLLRDHGEVLDLAPDVIGMRRGPVGARLAVPRTYNAARADTVPAWSILGGGDG